MRSREETSPSRAKLGDAPTSSVPAKPDHGENSASTIIEAPVRKRGPSARRAAPRADSPPGGQRTTRSEERGGTLDAHDFPDGGGSGGAERYSRRRMRNTP